MAPDEFKETHVIALQVHGPGVIHTVEKPVHNVNDMRGLKVRAPTRQVTKLVGALGAIPVGMPLPQIPDALTKGTINGCVIPWEVVPSVKVHELTKFHTEFPASGPALYTTTFVMAMNKAKYESLAPDLKKVIDANSGMATSAWLGKVQQGNDPVGKKPAVERGNTIYTLSDAEATSKAYWEYIQTNAPDEFKETHVVALHVHGPGMFHSATKLVKSPADLKGMKVRGPTRQVTKLLGALGATPVGMPLPQIPDALSKGTIDGCVIPWEVVPSVKVHELTKFHTEFPASGPALYTTTFVMAMNKAKYDGLSPDLRKVIDANSGLTTSAWLGKTQQGNDPTGKKPAVERGNTIYTLTNAEANDFIKVSQAIDDEWVADITKRGFDGKKLLQSARDLIAKHSKT